MYVGFAYYAEPSFKITNSITFLQGCSQSSVSSGINFTQNLLERRTKEWVDTNME